MPAIQNFTLKGTGSGNDKLFVAVSRKTDVGSVHYEHRVDGQLLKTTMVDVFARRVSGGHQATGITITEPIIRTIAGVETRVGYNKSKASFEFYKDSTDAERQMSADRLISALNATEQASFLKPTLVLAQSPL